MPHGGKAHTPVYYPGDGTDEQKALRAKEKELERKQKEEGTWQEENEEDDGYDAYESDQWCQKWWDYEKGCYREGSNPWDEKKWEQESRFFFPSFFCCLYVRARIFLFFIMATPFVFLCVIIVRCQRRVVQPERQEARSATRGNGNKVGKTQRFVGLRRYLRTPSLFFLCHLDLYAPYDMRH